MEKSLYHKILGSKLRCLLETLSFAFLIKMHARVEPPSYRFTSTPLSGRPRTLATRRAERAIITVLRRNRFASLHRIAADVRKELKLESCL